MSFAVQGVWASALPSSAWIDMVTTFGPCRAKEFRAPRPCRGASRDQNDFVLQRLIRVLLWLEDCSIFRATMNLAGRR